MKFTYIVALCVLVVSAIADAQPGMPADIRGAVYRVQTPSGKVGTGIMFRQKIMYFLVTNRHVVVDSSTGKPWDSLFVYLNRETREGEIVSGPERETVYTASDSIPGLIRSQCPGADLALVMITKDNTTFDRASGLITAMVSPDCFATEANLRRYLSEGGPITLIGYPYKRDRHLNAVTFPEYRWGNFVRWEGKYLVTDIPTLGGSSGSMMMLRRGTKYHFIGVHLGKEKRTDVTIGIPSTSIPECFGETFFKAANTLRDTRDSTHQDN